MSKLESAMDTLLEVFQYYSSKEGDKFQLNRVELRNLLRGELSQYLQDSRDPARVEAIMADLDKNLDGTVSFEEFVAMVTQLTVCSTSFFQEYTPVVIRCGQIRDGQFQAL
uniref:protein S100-A1-like n=1 Tax=Scatophagus argus TaxID=75038 RepID=UPI001ED8608B|nr:protein S100-A1-like [Scatophagus argus]XP_046256835.1 protein S100-A1-like [Scatophagus argus]